MSWEVMSSHKEPCDCGKGFKVIESRMDDWNRSDEKTRIECEDCLNEIKRKREQSEKTVKNTRIYKPNKKQESKRD